MARVKVTDPYSGATLTVEDDSPQAKAWGESSRRSTDDQIHVAAKPAAKRPRKSPEK